MKSKVITIEVIVSEENACASRILLTDVAEKLGAYRYAINEWDETFMARRSDPKLTHLLRRPEPTPEAQ